MAKQIHVYQERWQGTEREIRKAVMIMMGALLPGVYLHDHLAWLSWRNGVRLPEIEFGTIGISFYEGPGKRLAIPKVVQDISVPIEGETVLGVEDLGDSGGTLAFVVEQLRLAGAREILTTALYTKPAARQGMRINFCFGEVPQDTWIITPREKVETLMKRVPVWKEKGARYGECWAYLVELIGYPEALVNYYLPVAFGD